MLRSRSVAGAAVVMALSPVLAGAHCTEDCGPPTIKTLGLRAMERTMYGPGVLVLSPRVAPLASELSSFQRRELRIDASKPVAVVLLSAPGLAELSRADPARLRPGDHGDAFAVIAVVERGNVEIFPDEAARTAAARAGYDAVALVPRERGPAPWEASVTVDLGHKTALINDPVHGNCISDGPAPALPSWRLGVLPVQCGDGVRQRDEDCDDGNRAAGDGCDPYCQRER